MTNSEDYRLFLDERFESLAELMSSKFDNVHEKLIAIEVQTTKTNGRVTGLEKDLLTHPINCSKGKDIDAIKADLEEYRMIKKYPKLIVLLITAFILITFFSIYKSGKVPIDTKTVIQQELRNQEGISGVTRGGYVKYNDGGISDSVKVHNWGK
jgi:hypothetical protein